MRTILLQILLSAAIAVPQVPVSCVGTSSCCKMKAIQLQHQGPEVSQRACCCGIGDCPSKREPLAMAAVIHQGDQSTLQAPPVLLSFFSDTGNFFATPGAHSFLKRGHQGGSLFFARLFCVFRC